MLSYTEIGQGMAVVLLHGFPFSRQIWEDQISYLARHFRIIAPDLRGHGSSPASDGDYTMSLMADDVFELLDSLQIRKAAILGHSLGGYVALAGWRMQPERFLAIGLIASHPLADTEAGRQNRYRMAELALSQGNKCVVDALLPKLLASEKSGGEAVSVLLRHMILDTAPSTIAATQRGMAARSSAVDLLASISIPALILAGDSDQIVPVARARETADLFPNSTLEIISSAGHMPMLEQPVATSLALERFLGSVAETGT
jgi:3-oxoadipate enol-lactonase